MVPTANRSQLEVAAIAVALVYGTVLLVDGLRLFARYDELAANAAVPLFTAIPALAGAAWAMFVGEGRRLALAVGVLLPGCWLVLMHAPALMFVAPVGVILLLVADRSQRLHQVG